MPGESYTGRPISYGICRHESGEAALSEEVDRLKGQLKAAQKDLFDVNEFLVNELKVCQTTICLLPALSAHSSYTRAASCRPS